MLIQTNWIKINTPEVVSAKEALITLAHEGGHYCSYIRNKHRTGKFFEKYYSREKRERLAYLYGWALLNLIGATFVISKEDWKYYHEEL